MYTIPFSENASFLQEIELDSILYKFHFHYNTREQSWSFDMFDRIGTPILYGKKIVLHFNLLKSFTGDVFPKGIIAAIDTSGNLKSIGRNDFTNGRLSLVYIEENEL